MSVKLDLPAYLGGLQAHLMWRMEKRGYMDEVGAHYYADGMWETIWFPVKGSVDKAQKVIDEKVVPFLCAVFEIEPPGGPAAEA